MADSGYETYLLYLRGMQVDSEILFTNKGPIMVKESETFSKWPVSRSISRDQSSDMFSKSSNVLEFNKSVQVPSMFWH